MGRSSRVFLEMFLTGLDITTDIIGKLTIREVHHTWKAHRE